MKFRFKYKVGVAIFLFLFFSVVVIFLWNEIRDLEKKSLDDSAELLNDFAQIKKTGVLKVAIDYNSYNYFIYRGKPMGFEYELLQSLSNDLDVTLNIVVSNNLKE